MAAKNIIKIDDQIRKELEQFKKMLYDATGLKLSNNDALKLITGGSHKSVLLRKRKRTKFELKII